MKKNIIFMALALAGLVACEKSVPYEKGAQMDTKGPNVYFSNYNSPSVTLTSDATEFEIAVLRTDATDALTVPLKGVCAVDGIFQVPDAVEFASGVDSITVKIGVLDKVEMFTTYALTVSVPEEYTHQYAVQDVVPSCAIKVIKEDFVSYANGIFYDDFWTGQAWNAVLQYSPLLEIYRIQDPWGQGGDDFTFAWDGDSEKVTMGAAKYATGLVYSSYGAITANVLKDYTGYYHFEAGELMQSACDAFQLCFKWTVTAGSLGEYAVYFIPTEVL